jgi:tetratricopeptide (TPR) repeat protein
MQNPQTLARAERVHEEATQAFRSGDYARARRLFARARQAFARLLGPDHPQTSLALSDFGVACGALGEAKAACAAHEAALASRRRLLGDAHPEVGISLHNLGTVRRDCGDLEAAEACHSEALAIWEASLPAGHALIAKALISLQRLARARRDHAASLEFAERVLAIRLENLPEHDPQVTAAQHVLAMALYRLGRNAEAARVRDAALLKSSVFVQELEHGKPQILILSLSDKGNVPLEHILPEHEFTRIWWFLAHAQPPLGAHLPAYDVVFNGIGDPDMAGPAELNLSGFLKTLGDRRVLNHPDRVAATRRDRLADTLAGIDGVLVPATCRLSAAQSMDDFSRACADAGIVAPFLLRPAGAHGGAGILHVERWDDFDEAALQKAEIWYCSRFYDYRSPDGFFRKYRMAFVDRRPYPYHLAISEHWLVHYFSADMEAHDWKLAEEAAFLADPRTVLGERAYAALEALALRLDLDFCGADFSVLPDGHIIVFEANATMLIHPEAEDGRLAFKNGAVRTIVDAVKTLVSNAQHAR